MKNFAVTCSSLALIFNFFKKYFLVNSTLIRERDRRRTLGKCVYGKPYRRFESHSLRQKQSKSIFFEKKYDTNLTHF